MVRDIIDIDSTYEDFEAQDDDEDAKVNKKSKSSSKPNEEEVNKTEENSTNEDDEFNVSLAKMEEEIKPKILNILDSLNKNYSKLKKYQIEKLECLLTLKSFQYQKIKTLKKFEILVDILKISN